MLPRVNPLSEIMPPSEGKPCLCLTETPVLFFVVICDLFRRFVVCFPCVFAEPCRSSLFCFCLFCEGVFSRECTVGDSDSKLAFVGINHQGQATTTSRVCIYPTNIKTPLFRFLVAELFRRFVVCWLLGCRAVLIVVVFLFCEGVFGGELTVDTVPRHQTWLYCYYSSRYPGMTRGGTRY